MASGQCYGCGTSFGIFRKEHGCKNCGFAFCSRCLPKSIEVPKHNNAKHHVCNRCHEILTGQGDRERERQERERKAAPDAYYKRMQALQEGNSQHYGYGMTYNYTPAPTAIRAIPPQYRGLSRVDADIAMRLDKLKEKNQPLYSDRDITDRLARLKGTTLPHHTAACTPKKNFYHPPDLRPQQKQVDDLLNEICEEVDIDAKFDPAKDVEERLVKFKEDPNKKDGASKKPTADNNLNMATSGSEKAYSKNIRTSGGRSSRELTLDDVNSLIASMASDMEVDARKAVDELQKDKEIMEKLNEIKKKKNVKGETSEEDNEEQYMEDSDDEELAAKKIIKQYLEEVKLEERFGDIPSIDGQPTEAELKKLNTGEKKSDPSTTTKIAKRPTTLTDKLREEIKEEDLDEGEFDPDELPYCCICTNDATIRCLTCDFDLYCARCFKEAHDKLDMEEHVTVKYTPPKGSS